MAIPKSIVAAVAAAARGAAAWRCPPPAPPRCGHIPYDLYHTGREDPHLENQTCGISKRCGALNARTDNEPEPPLKRRGVWPEGLRFHYFDDALIEESMISIAADLRERANVSGALEAFRALRPGALLAGAESLSPFEEIAAAPRPQYRPLMNRGGAAAATLVAAMPSRRRRDAAGTCGRLDVSYPSPRKIQLAAAVPPRPVPTEYPARGRCGAATRFHGISSSRPRRRRDPLPRIIQLAGAPRPRRDVARLR